MNDQKKIRNSLTIVQQSITEYLRFLKSKLELSLFKQDLKSANKVEALLSQVENHPERYTIVHIQSGDEQKFRDILAEKNVSNFYVNASFMEQFNGSWIIPTAQYQELLTLKLFDDVPQEREVMLDEDIVLPEKDTIDHLRANIDHAISEAQDVGDDINTQELKDIKDTISKIDTPILVRSKKGQEKNVESVLQNDNCPYCHIQSLYLQKYTGAYIIPRSEYEQLLSLGLIETNEDLNHDERDLDNLDSSEEDDITSKGNEDDAPETGETSTNENSSTEKEGEKNKEKNTKEESKEDQSQPFDNTSLPNEPYELEGPYEESQNNENIIQDTVTGYETILDEPSSEFDNQNGSGEIIPTQDDANSQDSSNKFESSTPEQYENASDTEQPIPVPEEINDTQDHSSYSQANESNNFPQSPASEYAEQKPDDNDTAFINIPGNDVPTIETPTATNQQNAESTIDSSGAVYSEEKQYTNKEDADTGYYSDDSQKASAMQSDAEYNSDISESNNNSTASNKEKADEIAPDNSSIIEEVPQDHTTSNSFDQPQKPEPTQAQPSTVKAEPKDTQLLPNEETGETSQHVSTGVSDAFEDNSQISSDTQDLNNKYTSDIYQDSQKKASETPKFSSEKNGSHIFTNDDHKIQSPPTERSSEFVSSEKNETQDKSTLNPNTGFFSDFTNKNNQPSGTKSNQNSQGKLPNIPDSNLTKSIADRNEEKASDQNNAEDKRIVAASDKLTKAVFIGHHDVFEKAAFKATFSELDDTDLTRSQKVLQHHGFVNA